MRRRAPTQILRGTCVSRHARDPIQSVMALTGTAVNEHRRKNQNKVLHKSIPERKQIYSGFFCFRYYAACDSKGRPSASDVTAGIRLFHLHTPKGSDEPSERNEKKSNVRKAPTILFAAMLSNLPPYDARATSSPAVTETERKKELLRDRNVADVGLLCIFLVKLFLVKLFRKLSSNTTFFNFQLCRVWPTSLAVFRRRTNKQAGIDASFAAPATDR